MPSYNAVWIPTLATAQVIGVAFMLYALENLHGLLTGLTRYLKWKLGMYSEEELRQWASFQSQPSGAPTEPPAPKKKSKAKKRKDKKEAKKQKEAENKQEAEKTTPEPSVSNLELHYSYRSGSICPLTGLLQKNTIPLYRRSGR